jgi:hypothetical protein
MKSNVMTHMPPQPPTLFHIHLLTKMWHLVTTFHILVPNFLKYMNVVKLVLVQVVGSVVDKRCFSTLAFMKFKLQK